MELSDRESYISEIKHILAEARQKAYTAVNTAMVEAYWLVGKRIVEEEQKGKERADYGLAILEKLSIALGKGFSPRTLRDFRQFYLTFDNGKDLAHACAKLNWSHIRLIMRDVVAEAIFLSRYAEKAGSGILDMIDLCRSANLRTPQFRQEGGQFIQTLWRNEAQDGGQDVKNGGQDGGHEAQDVKNGGHDGNCRNHDGGHDGDCGGQDASHEAQDEVQDELDIALLKLCEQQERTREELLDTTGYPNRTGASRRILKHQLKSKLVEMTLPDKLTNRNQRYRITPKGRNALNNRKP